ncbi:MAG: alpha-hydroxy-acid oxidizing protein [Arenicellales bacterium]
MKEVTYVFGVLEESDVETLMRIGDRQELHVGDELVTQGTHPDAVYLVLEGKLSVSVSERDTPVAHVGTGEIVGEMSLLESQLASATVRAITPVTVLRIPRATLEENLAADSGFSMRFYRALGMLLSYRLRTATLPEPSKLRPVSELVGWASPVSTDMASLFDAACREYQARPAYRVNGTWITYADCRARVSRIAASLQERLAECRQATGEQPTIAVLLPNSHHVLELFFAAAVTDSILFPLNHRLSAAEIDAGLRASGAAILLTSDTFGEALAQVHWDTLSVRTLICTGAAVDLPIDECRSWDSLLCESAPPAAEPASPVPSSYLQGFSTSGTTGRTKTVLHTHHNVYVHSFASIQALKLSAGDDHCWGHFGPMFHVGDAAFVWIALILGARHVFHENQLHFEEVGKLMADEHVTIVKLVPSMLQLMCQSDGIKALRFPDLRWILTGGAATDPVLVYRVATLFDCDFIQGYGMTEATCHVAFKVETQAPMKEGLRVLPGLDLKVVDPDDETLGPGQVGEIVLKGETVFGSYLSDGRVETDDTQVFTRDGYYRSGDLGSLDEAGRVQVVGRRKDMINVGGENVFAWEVEEIINGMAGVKECAAFAMPDSVLGEVVEVAVVRTGAQPTAPKVKERCRKLLANFKVPHHVHFVDKLPRTMTGKVRKQLIADQIRATPSLAEVPPAPASPSSSPATAQTVAEIVTTYMGTLTSEPIDQDRPLFDAGLDSLGTLELIEKFEQRFSMEVPPTLLYDHPTIRELGAYFASSDASEPTAPAAEPQGATTTPPDATSEPPEPSSASRTRRSATEPSALLLQLVSLIVKPAVLALSIVPVLVLFDLSAGRLTAWELFLTGPVWLAMMPLTSMAVVLLAMRALGRSSGEGCELWSPGYFRWLFVYQLLRSVEGTLGVLRGTGILNTFYRLAGATIGKDVQLNTVTLHDPECVHIGDHTIIGRDVSFQPARIGGGRLVKQPIRVGSHCCVGPNSSLLGGAGIPDGTHIRPLSAVDTSVPVSAAQTSGAPGIFSESSSWSSCAAGYLVVGYLTAMAIAAGMLFVKYALGAAGIPIPSIAGVLLGHASAVSVPLSFFAALALAIYFVMPASYFVLVVVCRRLLPGSAQQASGEPGGYPGWSHWLYGKLVDVPFFTMCLQLNVMSHVTKWSYQLLGSRIGIRPFLAAPYTAEPELLEIGDRGMLAGNVSLYGVDDAGRRVGPIRVGESAVVTNSCVLLGGAQLSRSSLLGDLSLAGHDDVIPPNAVAVGSPPRVVGRTNFRSDTLGTGQYVLNQSLLVLLQWICLATSNMAGFALMGLCLIGLMAWAPLWLLWCALPGLLLLPRLVKVAFVPAVKWLALGKVAAGEHPAYGWYYTRWLLLETVVMDAEAAFLGQLQGTQFLNLLWRSLGAHVGSNACIFASSLGSEFDLKVVGSNTVLQYESLVFGHSIEHHSLLFKATTVEDGAEIGSFAIIEAGAVVPSGRIVPAHQAVHAQRARAERAAAPNLLNLHDFEVEAGARLPKPIFDYYAGGADDGRALDRNRQAFDWVRVCPRVLVDVSSVSTTCRLAHSSLASPVLIAPMAMQKLAHPQGESAVARAASQLNMGMVVSMLSTTALEPLGDLLRGPSGLPLLQLYLLEDRSLTEELIHRAEQSGYQGLVITVDAPASGRREADIRNQFAWAGRVDLPHLEGRLSATRSPLVQFETMKDSKLTWEHLGWLREQTKLPVWLKGILREEDVLRACESGYEGVVLSNHGGRQLDVALSPLEVLPSVRRAVARAGYEVELLVDGGIRRGSDVFKALGLGADAVLIGRPVLWGLAVNGQGGVTQVLNLLNEELALTMKLAGCAHLGDITCDLLYGDPTFGVLRLNADGADETPLRSPAVSDRPRLQA